MSKTVDFIFDFASPNAYFAHRVIPGIAERTGASFNYIPCLLGGIFQMTGNQAPMLAFANVKGKLDYDMLETRRFIEKHGLDRFKMNPHFPVNTLLLIRGAVAAREEGCLMPYIEAGVTGLWEQELNLDKSAHELLANTLDAAGLDGARIVERTSEQPIKDALLANTEAAVKRGAFGIPTFYVGDEMFFGKERLGQLEEMLLAG
ncbi:MAG: 2-hydroxychromene-2-carboxylate isomerase [Gammaproteobacteria bacterium AqS3]|nr:2-hydroxychromene-2-carboxylate isomerase [Gammaproteobacteria bacterium AqS3]